MQKKSVELESSIKSLTSIAYFSVKIGVFLREPAKKIVFSSDVY